MDHALQLPWWEFSPEDLTLPGSVLEPDTVVDEASVTAFLQAGSRGEAADRFISANSLRVAGVLETLSQDELVFPSPEGGEDGRPEAGENGRLQAPRGPEQSSSLRCRSRLLALPLMDRHAALNTACALTHRLPRRALVNFLCRLVLGEDVARVQARHHPHPSPGGRRSETQRNAPSCNRSSCPCESRGLCACGRHALGAKTTVKLGDVESSAGSPASSRARDPCAACRSCMARKEWLDSCSARLITVACRKILRDRTLPEDETLAIHRCLGALSAILSPPTLESPWPKPYWDKEPFYPTTASSAASLTGKGNAGLSTPTMNASGASPQDAADYPCGSGAQNGDLGPRRRVLPGTRGVSGILAGVARKLRAVPSSMSVEVGGVDRSVSPRGADDRRSAKKRPRVEQGEGNKLLSSTPPADKLTRRSASVSPEREDTSARDSEAQRDVTAGRGIETPEEVTALSEGGVYDSSGGPKLTSDGAGEGAAALGDHAASPSRTAAEGDEDCLPLEVREKVAAVAEKVAAAGARGATSADVQGAAAVAISLLQEAISSNASSARRPMDASSQQPRPMLAVVCRRLSLDSSAGQGKAGCGDDVVMAICNGFVTPALSLRNCLAFVTAVLVPRARSLTAPASRLLVTAVSGIGKARPGAVIDGFVLPLLCEGDVTGVGSAQCELCTRLIKQVLPKHTLEAVLVCLCGQSLAEGVEAGAWNEAPGYGGGGGNTTDQGSRSCVWTELTMPVITAALNLKPTLSDSAIGVLVRRMETASEQPKLQKSLKFTTLVHGLVTRYGPQLKPFLPALKSAIGRCSTFMVKAVMAALQRLDKN